MEVPFEFQAKDKKTELRISTELFNAVTKTAERANTNRLAYTRASVMEVLRLYKTKKLPKLKSKFDEFQQNKSMTLRMPTALYDEIEGVAKDLGITSSQLIREAIERML